MSFDGADYADAARAPKVVTHPEAGLTGACYGQGLRNSYFRARRHGQGGLTVAPPAEYDRPNPSNTHGALIFETRAAKVIVLETARWVAGHYNRALVHAVFQVLGDGGLADWQLRAGTGPGAILDFGPVVQAPLEPSSPATIIQYAPQPGDADHGFFEVVAGVELTNTPRDALVHFEVLAGADEEDDAGGRVAIGLELVSFSFWLESVG